MRNARVHRITIVTTFEAPPGSAVEQVLGPSWGITVRSRSVVGTACAGRRVRGKHLVLVHCLA